jgi:hypothetical protein
MVTACPVCSTATEQLSDGSREFHYHPDPDNPTIMKMCITSNPMFFTWPWVTLKRCGVCSKMVFVDELGIFNVHFDVNRTPCESSWKSSEEYPFVGEYQLPPFKPASIHTPWR